MAEKLEFKLQFDLLKKEELGVQETELLKEAQFATNFSYSPYSNFRVGAALLLEDGTILKGNNQENAAYPSGMCAERTALYYAGANYSGKKIIMIAIAARPSNTQNFITVSPCGSCRQAMSEYENQQKSLIRVIMQGNNDNIYISESVENLLPFKFSKEQLLG